MIKRIELREYQLESNDINNCDDAFEDDSIREQKQEQEQSTNNHGTAYSIVLHITTDREEIEVDCLGKLTIDKDKFNDYFDFLCNYQGISSTLNRVILEIKNNIL
jgi:hypothetical protein